MAKMDDQENEHEALEHILLDMSAEPVMLSYAFLRKITNNFSQLIGSGGFGEVYMGFLQNGKVAVKKLYMNNLFSEKQFEDELTCLIRVKHRNIVRFLGYCSDTQQQLVLYNGRHVLADVRRRFLCFEYVPNKGLHEYLKDESHRREWHTRYRLIEGICQGLRYLHIEERINHLDLKPENILLDADMVPKITDFGISRRFSGSQSRIITKNIRGSPGYMAPEYLNNGEISFKSDIFSLGIIMIKLLRGSNDFPDYESWHQSLDIDCPQMKRCIEIAQLCVDADQHKRPTIDDIINMLNDGKDTVRNNPRSSLEQESSSVSKDDEMLLMAVSSAPSQQQRIIAVPKEPQQTGSSEICPGGTTTDLLDVHPLELCFAFEPNKRIGCPICSSQQEPPPRDTESIEVFMIIMESKQDLKDLESSIRRKWDIYFLKRVEKLGGEVRQVILTVVICDQASCQAALTHQIISTVELWGVTSPIDVHPTETWILLGHHDGYVSIWNYQKRERVMVLMADTTGFSRKILSAKFIAREQWVAAADGQGYVHIQAYSTMDKVNKFEAQAGKIISLLAVHPTYPFLLSASYGDRSVKLWDWDQGWVCTRTFDEHPGGVSSLAFNPGDINTFAAVAYDGMAKVWNINSSNLITTLKGQGEQYSGDYVFTGGTGHYLVTCGASVNQIWDLQEENCVHTLTVRGQPMRDVACHPTLPLLATRSSDGTIWLWDASTCRLEKRVHLKNTTVSLVQGMAFISTKDSTSARGWMLGWDSNRGN
ncbi:hypothetical protein ACP70R_047892 [Stipagrostis hirtigluma subsp. patula]